MKYDVFKVWYRGMRNGLQMIRENDFVIKQLHDLLPEDCTRPIYTLGCIKGKPYLNVWISAKEKDVRILDETCFKKMEYWPGGKWKLDLSEKFSGWTLEGLYKTTISLLDVEIRLTVYNPEGIERPPITFLRTNPTASQD